MEAGEQERPWGERSCDRLPAGLVYVLGRNAIEAGLRRAGARVRSLSLGRPDLPLRGQVHDVFDVFFYGDARPGSFTAATARSDLLLMRWGALPVEVAAAVREQVAGVWLERRCTWAAAAAGRGDAWAAGEHRWRLVVEHGVLREVET